MNQVKIPLDNGINIINIPEREARYLPGIDYDTTCNPHVLSFFYLLLSNTSNTLLMHCHPMLLPKKQDQVLRRYNVLFYP